MSTLAFNASHTMADALRAAKDAKARVTVHLTSGAALTGHVGDLGAHAVVIQGLPQRDFFDALVDVNSIVAIEAQARTA